MPCIPNISCLEKLDESWPLDSELHSCHCSSQTLPVSTFGESQLFSAGSQKIESQSSQKWETVPFGSLYPWVIIHSSGTRLAPSFTASEAQLLIERLDDIAPESGAIPSIVDRVLAECRPPDRPPPGERTRLDDERRDNIIARYRARNGHGGVR